MNFSCITRALARAGRAIKNASPEIAIVAGTIGLVTAGVIACKETPKAMKVIEEHKEKMKAVDEGEEKGALVDGRSYSVEDARHDRALILKQDGIQLVKHYAPAVVLASLSVVSIFAGGKILRNRLTTVTAAYGLLEQRFAKYRNNVIEKYGADIDKELRYKLKDEISEVQKDDGTTEVKEVKTCKYDGYSDYARIFDASNPNWVKDGPRNLLFIENQQMYANDKLRIEGVLYLNDVYKMLGFPRSPEGQLVGWVYDPKNDAIDNFVDFGITEILRNKKELYSVMRDHDRDFILDFNCDGRIIDKMTHFEKY